MGFEEIRYIQFISFRVSGDMEKLVLDGNNPYISAWENIHIQRQIVVVRDGLKLLEPWIEAINLVVITLHPNVSVFVFLNVVQTIVAQSDTVTRMGFIVLEGISVEFVEAIPGSEPHEPFMVLQNAHDGALGEPVFRSVLGKGVRQLSETKEGGYYV